MKKAKIYQKGKHVYTKVGGFKEAKIIGKPQKTEYEFDENCQEVYVDSFKFDIIEKKMKLSFGKHIPGLNRIKLKRVISLDMKTARKFMQLLKKDFKL